MTRTAVRIHLEVDRDSDPISGLATDDVGRVCRFSNWLTLLAVVDDLRRAGETRGGGQSGRSAPGDDAATPNVWGASP